MHNRFRNRFFSQPHHGKKHALRLRAARLALGFSFALSTGGLQFCALESTTMETTEAYSQIYAAIDYKRKACGNWPGYWLVPLDNPPQYGVSLCTLTIIRQECPFRDYPLFCLEMYEIDVPLIGP